MGMMGLYVDKIVSTLEGMYHVPLTSTSITPVTNYTMLGKFDILVTVGVFATAYQVLWLYEKRPTTAVQQGNNGESITQKVNDKELLYIPISMAVVINKQRLFEEALRKDQIINEIVYDATARTLYNHIVGERD